MKRQVVFRGSAINDFRLAFSWYESRRRGLGKAFRKQILRQLTIIREMPEAFPRIARSIRRARVKRFPFGIYFDVTADRVVILAVFHFSKKPIDLEQR